MNKREKSLAYIAMEKTNNICYIIDIETYEILFMNKTARKLLGVKAEEYLNHKCYKIITGQDEICAFCANKHLKQDEHFRWEMFNPLLKKYFSLTEILFELDGRNVKLQIGVDINDAKNRLMNLETQLTLEATLVRCVQTLTEHEEEGSTITNLLGIVGEFYNADRVYIFEISDDNIYISNTYEWVLSGIKKQNLQKISIEDIEQYLKQLKAEGILYIKPSKEDKRFDLNTYNILGLEKLKSLLTSSLKINQKIIGFLGIDNPKNNVFETSLLRSVSLFISHDLKDQAVLRELKTLASVDTFSGVFNRNKYMQVIEQLVKNKIDSVGIVYLDINGLKQINDEYGHMHGDSLILKVVTILKSCFMDNIFRIGGDEFVALIISNDRTAFERNVSELRNRTNIQTEISVSVGSTWCSSKEDISEQIAYANELMYVEKQHYYTNRKSNRKNYRASTASDLHEAIKANEFFIMLQPKIRLSDEKIIGAEALVRQKDGKGGFIAPCNFVPIYESDGIIPLLDFYVLESTCELLKKWREEGHTLINISVNFSRITILEYKLTQKISTICQKYGIESKFITIELTENISNISLKNLNEILEEVRLAGFQISLDDFGCEYANLSILTNIAFDEIKLDKSLIDDLVYSPAISTVIRHIVGMCNAFRHTKIVAEGIETHEQAKILSGIAPELNIGQGYYFSKPLLAEEFLNLYIHRN